MPVFLFKESCKLVCKMTGILFPAYLFHFKHILTLVIPQRCTFFQVFFITRLISRFILQASPEEIPCPLLCPYFHLSIQYQYRLYTN